MRLQLLKIAWTADFCLQLGDHRGLAGGCFLDSLRFFGDHSQLSQLVLEFRHRHCNQVVTFTFGGLQKAWWRYAGLADLVRIFVADVVASAMSAAVLFLNFGQTNSICDLREQREDLAITAH
jgi:hypothetical protein